VFALEQVDAVVTSTATESPSPTPTLTNTPGIAACAGDCNQDGVVSVNELATAVNIALGVVNVDQCATFDADKNGSVTVDELVKAVNAALTGCTG
jgi:hypothetical protein